MQRDPGSRTDPTALAGVAREAASVSDEYYQFPALVELAVVTIEPGREAPIVEMRGSPLSDRARPVVSRIGRTQLEVRDALWAVLDALGGVERTVDWMRATMTLQDQGVQLSAELVLIGADGVQLHRQGPWADGQPVRVYLVLPVKDVQHLMPLRAEVEHRADGAFLAFQDLRGDERNLLVAFVFQQELKERHRALAHPG